jgi:hypothetical protein
VPDEPTAFGDAAAGCGAVAGCAAVWVLDGCACVPALSRYFPKDDPPVGAAAGACAADDSAATGGRESIFMPEHAFHCQPSLSKLRANPEISS